MRSFGDLVVWVSLVLAPDFDLDAAQRRFGHVSRWNDFMGEVDRPPPAFRSLRLERARGRYAGIQARLATPLVVDWARLTGHFGEPRDLGPAVDDWGGPSAFQFTVRKPRAMGNLVLYAHRRGATAEILRMIARPIRG